MKTFVLLWLGLGVLLCPMMHAAIYEIGEGEYNSGLMLEDDVLVIDGGGAKTIDASGSSSITIIRTSTPLISNSSGVYSIWILDNSELTIESGAIGGISLSNNTTAVLSGGSISHISSYQDVEWWDGEPFGQHIEIICISYDLNASNLLTGVWGVDINGDNEYDTFAIQLHDQAGYDPVITNIDFTIVNPEPATLFLLSLGGLILRKK